jgi:CubicO group peptidase (beta-lactamase class C family)
MNTKRLQSLIGLLLVAMLLVACGGQAAEPVAVAPTAAPAVEALPPPSPTPLPATATPIPPTATTEPPTTTPEPATGLSDEALAAKIDEYMTMQTEGNRFSGAVLVARDGEVIISKGYGLADQEEQIPNTPQTRFRIASLTKAFTAMAIMQLQEAGRLNVTDSICNYLPDCPPTWEEITIHHLLTHTSGLPDQFASDREYAMTRATPTVQGELLANLQSKPMRTAPGSTYYYKNANYIILGYIIEAVTGRSYEEVLQAQIFDPLGMTDSGYSHDTEGLAVGYVNQFREADFIDMSHNFAAGALYSTV